MFQGGAGDLAGLVWPGESASALFLAHATGFCKEVWAPVVHHLRGDFAGRVVAWDSRAHGSSDSGPVPFDWWDLARDTLDVVEAVGAGRRVGVGHSMGGAALAMAEITRPGTFDGLVLIEPIVFPPPYGRFDSPLVEVALKRRSSFPSPEAASQNFADKAAFAGWDARAMDAYVAGGLRAGDGHWVLCCRPDHEAELYRGGSAHGAYERLAEIEAPVLVLAGEHSTTHGPEFVELLRSRLPHASATTVPDAGHFLPMERPETVADLILRFIEVEVR